MPKYVAQHNIGLAFYGWASDWPDGYGEFFYHLRMARRSVPTGNTNQSELNDPVVNNMFDKRSRHQRQPHAEFYTEPDRQAGYEGGGDPAVVYAKSLLYRPSRLTNVYFNQAYYGITTTP